MLHESDLTTSKGSEHAGSAEGTETNGAGDAGKLPDTKAGGASPDLARPSSGQPDAPDAPDVAQGTVPGFWPVLQNLNFLTLWSGQVFSQLADKIYLVLMIAIIAAQYEVPGQTISGWVSAVMIAFTIPAVLFGSLAGVY
ncbi:MAG: arabinose efflux permease, partial [Cyanobacteria bacterium P01_A01_bin.15]